MIDLIACERLRWLVANVHTLTIEWNDHRSNYETVEMMIKDRLPDFPDDEARMACIATNEIITMQIYPDTPVGSVFFAHHDLGDLIAHAYAFIQRHREYERNHEAKAKPI